MLDKILKEWKEDSRIDDLNLDVSAMRCANMHSKYLELHCVGKLRLKKMLSEFAILERDKWLYYMGKMTKDEMDSRGWPYDPFQGMTRPLKSDMEIFLKTDKDISGAMERIEYQKTIIDALDEILQTIKWRHQTLRVILEQKKFVAGC